MAEATLHHGEYRTMQYTPSSGAIDAGDMVVIGSVTANTNGVGALLGVAHRDIANNVQGTLAIGGGVYDCVIASNYAEGVVLYKPSGNAILTTTGTNNARFGVLLEAAAAANAVCQVLHDPTPDAIA
jgi:predicted RecA/RadA family phage recombinase